ncbi:MAG TPA: DUF3971 domain-containing protein [Xanthobacteraceae bacterium]
MGMRLDLQDECGRLAGDAQSGMTDSKNSPRLAALRSLEESLLSHHRAQRAPAVAAARSDAPPGRPAPPGGGSSRRFRIPAFLRGRRVRNVGLALTVLVAIAAMVMGALWYRLSSGPIALDFATDWLAAAIKENLGNRYSVDVGGTVLERDENGRTALRIRDIVVRDGDGVVVANAPRAEVGLAGISVLTGHPRAESLNLVGAELSVRVEQNGDVTVFAAADKRPLARAPMLAAAATRPGADTAMRGIGNVAAPASARGGLDNLGAVLAWLDSVSALGLDGHDLGEVGLKSGNLTVEDLRNGQQSKFEKINLSLTRHPAGEVVLRISSDNPDRPWVLLAGVKPLGEGRRAVSVEARKIMMRDLLLALRLGDGQIDPDLPLSVSLRAELARDGTPQTASGQVLMGPGTITDAKDPEAHVAIDRAELSVDWDASRRSFAAPFQIVSGNNRITLVAHAEAPPETGGPWSLGLTGGSIVLGPIAQDDEQVTLNRIAVLGRYDTAKRRLDIDHADITGKDVGIAASGYVDFSTSDPRIVIGAAGRNMTAASFKQLWPVFVNTPVRDWTLEHLLGGSVDRVEIATNAPMSAFKAGGPPVPDDGLSVEIATSATVVKPVDTLPAIHDADIITRVSGRSVTISLGRGVVDLPSGRRLTIANGVFEIPDSQVKKPPARVRMRIEGPVPAAAELLSMDRLREASGSPLDPAGSKGAVTAQVTLELPIDPEMPKGSVNYNVVADIANFSVDRFAMAQRIEAQTLRVTANTDGYQARGDVRIGGMPAMVDYRKPRGDGEAELRLQATFDDAARTRFGFDLNSALSGPVPIKLGGKIPSSPDQDSRFAVEADLTQARVDNLLPGWSKPQNKATRAAFTMTTRKGANTKIDDIVVDGAGVAVKGSVEIDTNSEVVLANFPVFGMSSDDKASLKAERLPDGPLKVTMRGDVYDGRSFIKSVMGGPSGDSKPRRGIADLDLDVKIGAVAGFHGEALRALDLRLLRRSGQIKSFAMSAKLGVDAALSGDLRGRAGGRQVLYFESADAGALLRFTDTYPRMVGGQMWAAMDPPGLESAPQEGLLNIRDFTVRGEAALDRVVAGAPGMQSAGVDFSRMRVEFLRSPGKFTIKDAVVRGPAMGATMDGVLDYGGNDVRLRGTFVPLYGLNNMFGQIPIVGLFLGGGDKEGLVGITFEVVGPPGAPVLRVNPISAVAPGLLRKVFEFPSSVPGERYPDPRSSYADRDR